LRYLIIWTDNAPHQYRCRQNFIKVASVIERHPGIKLTHRLAVVDNFKGVHDAVGKDPAHLVRKLELVGKRSPTASTKFHLWQLPSLFGSLTESLDHGRSSVPISCAIAFIAPLIRSIICVYFHQMRLRIRLQRWEHRMRHAIAYKDGNIAIAVKYGNIACATQSLSKMGISHAPHNRKCYCVVEYSHSPA